MENATAKVLMSMTAPGKIFSSRAELAEHYRSDWHLYNSKRREKGLPMVSEIDFRARLAAVQASLQVEQRTTTTTTTTDHPPPGTTQAISISAYLIDTYRTVVPDKEYLVDLLGLIGYCHEKIHVDMTCLYCQRVFTSPVACRNHMIAVSHTKLRYEPNADLYEFYAFYDFSNYKS